MKDIGQKIKFWREKKGLAQSRLAELTGLHITTIGKIEAKMSMNPEIDTLQKIANALDISLTELLNPPKGRR